MPTGVQLIKLLIIKPRINTTFIAKIKADLA
jgi:hypothetical protein